MSALLSVIIRQNTPEYVSIRHHMTYDIIRQHTSAYVSIRQHTSAYSSIRLSTVVGEPPAPVPHPAPPSVVLECFFLMGFVVSSDWSDETTFSVSGHHKRWDRSRVPEKLPTWLVCFKDSTQQKVHWKWCDSTNTAHRILSRHDRVRRRFLLSLVWISRSMVCMFSYRRIKEGENRGEKMSN